LARALGCSVEELGERISAHEFGEWFALYRSEPWGEVRSDIAIGQVAAVIANVNRSSTTKAFSPMDFCPYLKPREEPKEMAPAEFLKQVKRG
jgi:hypothetical protein